MRVLIKRKHFPFVEYLFISSKKHFLFKGFLITRPEDLEKVKERADLTREELNRLQKMLIPQKSVVVMGAIYPVEIDFLEKKVKLKNNSIAYPLLKVFPYKENIEVRVGKYLKSKVEKLIY